MNYRLTNIGYLKLACNVSKHSKFRYQVGAVICMKKPIAIGFNKERTHPLHSNPSLTNRSTIHAEMDALIHYKGILDGATIYTYRENQFGTANSRPCLSCIKKLKKRGIKTMIYTIDVFPYWRREKI